jgi:hypothetical protein
MLKFAALAALCCCGPICSETSACNGRCACPCAQGTAAVAVPSMPGMAGLPAQANAGGQYPINAVPHLNASGHSAAFKQTDF